MTIRIGDRLVGPDQPCLIIAEAGLNHNGDLDIAKRLIDVGSEAGADVIKFQKRTVDVLATDAVLDAEDQRFPEFGRTYRQIREHIEFGLDEFREIISYADEKGIMFLCTAFDVQAVDFMEDLGVSAHKVASHSVTNLPLLKHLSTKGKPVIMSTGMCTLDEVDEAVAIFKDAAVPLALLHCVSAYPQPAEESNASIIPILRERYCVPIGYSGHELNYIPTIVAVTLGAAIVERHITLDRTMKGFDHKLSLEPGELTQMVHDIREAKDALGSGKKAISEIEMMTRNKYRVSIVATHDIQPGQTLTEDALTLKNPGTGLPARDLGQVLGRKAKVVIAADTLLAMDMLA